MRSVIHEASTIAKALEQGWIKAGKPRNFSVKIFEEPQTKLFGLITARNAKVGIFVEDRKPQQQDRQGGRRHAPSRRRFQHRYDRPAAGPQQNQNQPARRPEQQKPPEHHDYNDSDNDNNTIE